MDRMVDVQKTVVSADGTTIAYEQAGSGPVVILVSAALADRTDAAKLAQALAGSFTVINYDRRGRGGSTDTPPYAVDREIEDLKSLIHAAGEPAFVFGSSSGAILALEAASRLGSLVRGVFLYEPPFIIDNTRPPMPADFAGQIGKLLSDNRRSDAVRLFFTRGMGIPSIFVTLMRWLMPGWSKMAAIAHTILYDLAVLAGTQDGKPLPLDRWAAARMPVLVMVGAKSEPFFHTGAKALASQLSDAQYCSLEGRDHSAVMTAPREIAAAVKEFSLGDNRAALASI